MTGVQTCALPIWYWAFFVQLFNSQHAVSVHEVHKELCRGRDDDPLKTWAQGNKQHFVAPDTRVVSAYQEVMNWARTQNYKASAINEFQGVADSWIVAYALANNWEVVTREKSAPESKRRIKIPDVSAGVGVACIGPFEMLRREGMSLVL